MKIVIGYDGSPSASEIFEDLKSAGLPKRLDAMVVTVAEIAQAAWVQTMTRGKDGKSYADTYIGDAITKANATAKSAADLLARMFPLWNVSFAEGQWESPIWSLIQKAEEWEADLLVVGARGHSTLARFLGSVSQMILAHSRCSVRIARAHPDRADAPGLRVLVGYDGSPGSEKALAAVAARPWPAGTNIRVVSAFHLTSVLQPTPILSTDVRIQMMGFDEQRRYAEETMEHALHPLRNLGLEAEAFVREGTAKNLLVEEAEAWKADCIFLGASGMRTVRRFFLGGVSAAVTARAHCSVEVIR